MIEVSIKEIDGVKFLKNIRILEPDDSVGGMGVHRIDRRIATTEFMRAIKAMGLKKVGEAEDWDADLYTQSPLPYLPIKLVQFALRVYWRIIRWLYNNARIFKQIPTGQPFSWAYFTPYTWFKSK